MSIPVLTSSGPLKMSDMRYLDSNTVHILASETINGVKTFNSTINTNNISNTGLITSTNITTNILNTNNITTNTITTSSLLLLNGKKYIRLLNLSNFDTSNSQYNEIVINLIPNTYNKISMPSLIRTSITDTYISLIGDEYLFNEIGDYYVCFNIIYSVDSLLIKKINIIYSLDGINGIIDQDINILNLKHQIVTSQIYYVSTVLTKKLNLYIYSNDDISVKIYKINLDIIKLN